MIIARQIFGKDVTGQESIHLDLGVGRFATRVEVLLHDRLESPAPFKVFDLDPEVNSGCMCSSEESGESVSFLASDRAAMITGQMLAVDGSVLTGYGEDLRALVRKRMAEMKAAGEARK